MIGAHIVRYYENRLGTIDIILSQYSIFIPCCLLFKEIGIIKIDERKIGDRR